MTARPEPVEAYLLCELPVGTKYRYCDRTAVYTANEEDVDEELVYVVEWPQRTYDGIPADDLDRVVARLDSWTLADADIAAIGRIRAAIEAQEQAS